MWAILVVASVVTLVFFRCVPVGTLGVPDVIDVLVSPLSVGVPGVDFPSNLECEIAEPQSFSVSRKRQTSLVESQGSM